MLKMPESGRTEIMLRGVMGDWRISAMRAVPVK